MSSELKTVKLPTFDGKRESFHMWWTRFCSYAMMYKFSPCLKPIEEVDLPADEEELATDTDEEKAARKRNALAMYNFMLAFSTEGLMGIIFKARTTLYPNGKAYKVVEMLFAKYKPSDTISRVEMRTKLAQVSMKKNEDPTAMFERISLIENQYNDPVSGRIIDPEDLIATVLSAAPDEYKSLLTSEQRMQKAALKMEHLEEAMYAYYRSTVGSQVMAAAAKPPTSGGKEFMFGTITCYKCGKDGHIAKNCHEKATGSPSAGANSKGGKPKPKCTSCGRIGHTDDTCWENEANAEKRPAWWKDRNKNKPHDNNNEVAGVHHEVLFCTVTEQQQQQQFPNSMKLLSDPNIWIIDSGATADMTSSANGMINVRNATTNESARCANGQIAVATKQVGKIPTIYCDKNGTALMPITMQEVTVTPDCPFNIISATNKLKNGWKIYGDNNGMTLTKNDINIVFDIHINTPKGVLYAAYFKRVHQVHPVTEIGMPAMDDNHDGWTLVKNTKGKKWSIMEAHVKYGHHSEAATRAIAKINGVELSRGTLGVCESCTIGKAKQKNVPKATDNRDKLKDEESRMFMDLSTLRSSTGKKSATKGVWCMMTDQRTRLQLSQMFATKNGMVEPTCEKLQQLTNMGLKPTYIRLDNAGENKLLEQRCRSKDWKHDIKFEYTARNTPQQNSLVEVSFGTTGARARAMMIAANVPDTEKHLMMPEAALTASKLANLIPESIDGVYATRHKHFYGVESTITKYLKTWDEAGTVTIKSKLHPKSKDRGIVCMMVGYADNHTPDCYQMYDPKTKRVHVTRDVIWLRRMYYQPKPSDVLDIEVGEGVDVDNDVDITEYHDNENHQENDNNIIHEDENNDNNDRETEELRTVENLADTYVDAVEEDEQLQAADDDYDAETVPAINTTTSSGRAVRAPQRYIEIAEIALSSAEAKYYEAMEDHYKPLEREFCLVGAGIGGGFENTQELHVMKYEEAMRGPDAKDWDKAVIGEHNRMTKHEVFEVKDKATLPKGTKVLTSTWAMKKKANGTLRARINARGYEQVDGVHYDEDDKAAPVASEITIRVAMVLMLMADMCAELIDVNSAFLYGMFKPQHKLHMEIPKGFQRFYPKGSVLLLLKTIYGTKQAALAFWEKFMSVIRKIKFYRSKADACMYYRWSPDGLTICVSWVDDVLICGPRNQVARTKTDFGQHFECDEQGKLKEYIGCKIDRDVKNQSIKFTQPVMLQSFEDEFELPEGDPPELPATAGDVLKRAEDVSENIGPTEQSTYRSGVGKLLHMMRWSRPDILNRVRELSRYMTGATPKHYKEMLRVMRWCVSTPDRGLTLKPNCSWDGIDRDFEFIVSGMSDSDYNCDPETRHSISGTATFLCGAVVSMKSRMQKCVTLSVTEAEFVAAVDCVQDMLFTMRVVESMGLKVKLPMILEVDNKGAVDLANSWTSAGRTRHVATRINFLRELKEQGLIHVKWLSSDYMSSDIFTKNTNGPDFKKHIKKFVGEDDYG